MESLIKFQKVRHLDDIKTCSVEIRLESVIAGNVRGIKTFCSPFWYQMEPTGAPFELSVEKMALKSTPPAFWGSTWVNVVVPPFRPECTATRQPAQHTGTLVLCRDMQL